MRISLHILLAGYIFIASHAAAQETGTVRGTISDARTEEALPGANVYLIGTQIGAASDADGYFEIRNVPAGTYTVTGSFVGYTPESRRITLAPGGNVSVSFMLSEKTLNSGEIVISREMLLGGAGAITGIPGSAYYIDKKELATFSYTDIHRVLRTIPGINIQEEDGYGLRPNIGMRGTGVERSQKINIMEDGVLIAPAPYSAPAAYYFPTVGRMEGIEVRKGSSQIKYGPYTTGGALNLMSTSIPVDFTGRVNLSAGGYGARELHATVGNSNAHGGFLVESFQMNADGFKRLDTGGATGFDKKDYLVKLRFNTSSDANIYQSLTFKAGQTEEISHETYLGLTDGDFTRSPYRRYAGSQKDIMNADHSQIAATYFLKPGRSFDITTTVYRNTFARNWFKLDRVRSAVEGSGIKIADILESPSLYTDEYAIITGATSQNDNALDVKANNRSYLSQGIQSIAGLEIGSGAVLHQIELGVRFHEDEVDRFQWIDQFRMENGTMELTKAGIPGTESNRIGSAAAWSAFIQYRVKKGNITAVPGLRYENMTLRRDDYGPHDPDRTGSSLTSRHNDVSIWIPGVGINYLITPTLRLFTGVHRGFSPPGSREGTKPETSINYELGSRYSRRQLTVEAVFFSNDYNNLLGADLSASGGSGSGDLFNGGDATIKGIEYSLRYDFGESAVPVHYSLPVGIAYTFTSAVFNSGFASEFEPWGIVEKGDELPYLPRHQLALYAGLNTAMGSINLSGKYVGTIRTEAGKGAYEADKSIDAVYVVDATAEFSLTPKNKIFITVNNITDNVYMTARRPAGVRPGLPRTIMVGIKSDF